MAKSLALRIADWITARNQEISERTIKIAYEVLTGNFPTQRQIVDIYDEIEQTVMRNNPVTTIDSKEYSGHFGYSGNITKTEINQHDYNPIIDKYDTFYSFAVYWAGRPYPNLISGYFKSKEKVKKMLQKYIGTGDSKYVWGDKDIN